MFEDRIRILYDSELEKTWDASCVSSKASRVVAVFSNPIVLCPFFIWRIEYCLSTCDLSTKLILIVLLSTLGLVGWRP